MLTRVTIRNFKRFDEVSVELGNPVVFIGPNNSGKTTALQALALWDLGVRRLREKQGQAVALNRRDLIGLPVPELRMLWHNCRVSEGPIHLLSEGVTDGSPWALGLDFHYDGEDYLLCRALEIDDPSRAVKFLAPKLLVIENRLEALKRLGHQVALSGGWNPLRARMRNLFEIDLHEPRQIPERDEIQMTYRNLNHADICLDISSATRGMQNTLVLFSQLILNPCSVLLIDEFGSHLDSLRQRQAYHLLSDTAREYDCQIVMAGHSAVILNEAVRRDMVIAFLGKPHRIDNRGSQLLKSLKEIGFEQYYQAEQTGWVFYLEGSTDLGILRTFAETLAHPARRAIERPFVHYVENQPRKAQDHFYGLREAKQDLQGFALFDRLTLRLEERPHLEQRMWRRREIESYLCFPETLLGWAQAQGEQNGGPDLARLWRDRMQESMARIEAAMQTLGKGSPWSPDTKVSDDFLDPLFENFFRSLDLPNLMRKTDYHTLARYVPPQLIDPEVGDVLDQILAVCERATPMAGQP